VFVFSGDLQTLQDRKHGAKDRRGHECEALKRRAVASSEVKSNKSGESAVLHEAGLGPKCDAQLPVQIGAAHAPWIPQDFAKATDIISTKGGFNSCFDLIPQ
jgi:hypothetical protein